MPAPPEIADAPAAKGIAEVLRQVKAKETSQPYRHIAVGGEIQIHIQKKRQSAQPGQRRRGLPHLFTALTESIQAVCQQCFFCQPDRKAERSGGKFTGCVIPNVFGPFGRPNYNSVVATFCHKLTHSETPEILVDGQIKLIYVGDLCREFIARIRSGEGVDPYPVPWGAEETVSGLLATLRRFKETYFDQGIIPELHNRFEVQLFNTFCAYIDARKFFPYMLKKNSDARGSFVETVRLDHIGGQVSFSTTVPGVTRGNHYHTRKIERFAVIRGKARIELRRIGTADKMSFELDGEHPSFVDMPVWHTHNITNTGTEDLYTIFWINEFYDPKDPDTFFEEV